MLYISNVLSTATKPINSSPGESYLVEVMFLQCSIFKYNPHLLGQSTVQNHDHSTYGLGFLLETINDI